MQRIARATGASDRALDVAESRVDPFKMVIGRAPAAVDYGVLLEACRREAVEAGQPVADHGTSLVDARLGILYDGVLGERQATQLGVERAALTGLRRSRKGACYLPRVLVSGLFTANVAVVDLDVAR
jgi:hypothetical protein